MLIAGTLFATSACGGNTTVPTGTVAGLCTGRACHRSGRLDLDFEETYEGRRNRLDGRSEKRRHGAARNLAGPIDLRAQEGQLLVCNFADSAGTAGKGTTIEVLNPKPHSKPATFTQSTKIEGCDGDAITETNQVYGDGDAQRPRFAVRLKPVRSRRVTVRTSRLHSPTPMHSAACLTRLRTSTFRIPRPARFSSWRSSPSAGGKVKMTEVITGFGVNKGSGWSVLGPSGMQYDSQRTGSLCNDTLYIVDGVDNTVVAVSTASNLLEKDEIVVQPGGKKFKCAHPKATCATLVYSGSPLNAPVASALLPNGNLIVANTKGGNKLVELTPAGKCSPPKRSTRARLLTSSDSLRPARAIAIPCCSTPIPKRTRCTSSSNRESSGHAEGRNDLHAHGLSGAGAFVVRDSEGPSALAAEGRHRCGRRMA